VGADSGGELGVGHVADAPPALRGGLQPGGHQVVEVTRVVVAEHLDRRPVERPQHRLEAVGDGVDAEVGEDEAEAEPARPSLPEGSQGVGSSAWPARRCASKSCCGVTPGSKFSR
jgi:hypothetical protein